MGELVLMKQEIQQLCKFTSTADTFSDSDMFAFHCFLGLEQNPRVGEST